MTGTVKLKLLCSAHCKQYNSDARFFIDEAHPSGQPHLIVQYGDGYGGRDDLPIVDGHPQFAAGIPKDWTEQDVMDLILWPMKSPAAPYPAWEVPARVHGSSELFRWWAGEKPR